MSAAAARNATASVEHEPVMREVVERLAPLVRRAGSEDERAAAEWLAARLETAGCAVTVDHERFGDGYAPLMVALCALGTLGGAMALTPRGRIAGAALAAAAGLLVADDISNGPRLFRRAVAPEKPTQNVIAEASDPVADRTLVVIAHHDAARSGRIFDPSAQQWFGDHFPEQLERTDTGFPLWWPVLGAFGLVVLGGLTGWRRTAAAGFGLCGLATASFADIARSPLVPGANDNLSGVAVLVALAEKLRTRPVAGLRVLLVSCGAEEVIQGGINGFVAKRLSQLDPARTWVLNLDSVGSPRLVMLEGEGPVVMEDYCDPGFRDLVARVAERAGIPLRRGLRARASTDAVIPSRAGYATAGLASVNRYKAISNYHQMTDTPENLDYGTVAQAAALGEALARELAPAR